MCQRVSHIPTLRWQKGPSKDIWLSWKERRHSISFEYKCRSFPAVFSSFSSFSSFQQLSSGAGVLLSPKNMKPVAISNQTTVPLLGKIAMALAWTFVLLASLHYICADCLCKIARRLTFIQYHQVQSITINDHQFWATSACEFSSTSDEHQKNKWLFAKF